MDNGWIVGWMDGRMIDQWQNVSDEWMNNKRKNRYIKDRLMINDGWIDRFQSWK